ncbi:MAG: amidohydrolase family protein [Gemmatimonadota bacterium]|nr:amidohydrolase family protein [Gemmatimonadota bacterium]
MITTLRRLAIGLALVAAGCEATDGTSTTAFTGATVWDGTGSPPIADATILVREGRVVSVESNGAVPSGATEIGLDGRYVVPGLVNAHGHVSGAWADGDVVGELERVRGDLELFARYGVTTVNSLGDGEPVVAARDSASDTDPRARLRAAGPVITAEEPAAAREAALDNAEMGVDWLKLRVDDNLGTSAKMPWNAVQAVLTVGDETGIPVATHLFYLEDAKRLLEMGTAMVAHSVRDRPVDAAFTDRLRASGVCYVPTLTREVSTFVYADRPEFFDDPFFIRFANSEEVARLSQADFMRRMADSPTAAGYREGLAHAKENVKTLHDAGVMVAMGTDAGPAGRFPGYFEHMELWMMVDAGLSPADALRSATAVAAECARVDDVGTLEPGHWADFLVLGEDPLVDIRATRSLERVYIAGARVAPDGPGG